VIILPGGGALGPSVLAKISMADQPQKVAQANEMVAKLEQLFTAASEGDAKAFRKILKQEFKEVKDLQALTDGRRRTLLHHAASNGRDNICVHLIEDLEFDINRQDVSGETPLAYASSKGHLTTMKLLMDNGAKPSLRAPSERCHLTVICKLRVGPYVAAAAWRTFVWCLPRSCLGILPGALGSCRTNHDQPAAPAGHPATSALTPCLPAPPPTQLAPAPYTARRLQAAPRQWSCWLWRAPM
jgi:hypothetical protein